jgi:hypothetical protein
VITSPEGYHGTALPYNPALTVGLLFLGGVNHYGPFGSIATSFFDFRDQGARVLHRVSQRSQEHAPSGHDQLHGVAIVLTMDLEIVKGTNVEMDAAIEKDARFHWIIKDLHNISLTMLTYLAVDDFPIFHEVNVVEYAQHIAFVVSGTAID